MGSSVASALLGFGAIAFILLQLIRYANWTGRDLLSYCLAKAIKSRPKMKSNKVSTKKMKIDPLLEDALSNPDRDKVLTVTIIFDLRSENEEIKQQPKPCEFESRSAWREALIEQRQAQISSAISDQIKKLKSFSLIVRGGVTTPVLVVEGTVANILKALEALKQSGYPIEIAESTEYVLY